MNIYIGNLAKETTETDIREEFEAFGKVSSVSIARSKRNGVSKGFAHVEMASREEGLAAIDALKGQELNGRTMDVTEAPPPSKGKKGFKGGSKKRRH